MAFGLDISDLAIRIIQLKKRRGGFKLISWGETEIRPDLIENGEIKNENKFAELLKQSIKNIKGKKIKTRNAIVSLPEKKAFLAIVQMPTMKKEELQSAITFQAENYIPLPVNETYLDFQVFPVSSKTKDRCEVLLVAFPKKIIDQQLVVLKKAGILPLAFEIESQAITRVLARNNEESSPFFMINFGENNTIFAIFSENSLRFSSSIPISSQDLTKAVSQAFKIDLTEAEKLKYSLTLSQSQRKEKEEEIFRAMETGLNDLCEQVKKYISYYQTYGYPEYQDPDKEEVKSKKIEKIILCGKGADLKGLSDFLSSKLAMPVKLASPWLNVLKKETTIQLLKKSPGYITALGLALKGAEGTMKDFF